MNIPQHHLGIGMTSRRTRERLVQRLRDEGIVNIHVLEVMRTLPRHLFIDEALASRAYEDTALPIGHGQTISRPYTVARMTEALLEGTPPRRVLEVGTGCGYQTAVLASLVERVYSIERIAPLLERAKVQAGELRLNNVLFRLGDGFAGWPEMAPFDAMLVAAAPNEVPESLLQQLADDGRMIIPAGVNGEQQLLRIVREGNRFHREVLEAASFVPMLEGVER